MSKSKENVPFDMQLKLLIIGDSGVGKTCLLLRYADNSFSPTFKTTIGIDFSIKNILLLSKRVKVQMWDTAGNERFRTITTSYFRGTQGIFIVYDVTDRNSFTSVRYWIAQIRMHADPNVNITVLGGKCDVYERRVVSCEEGESLAAEYGVPFYEVSAKDSTNVDTAFEEMSALVMNRLIADGGSSFVPQAQVFSSIASEIKIAGALSWYNKSKINGRYIPDSEVLLDNRAANLRLVIPPNPKNVWYRNIDTPNTILTYSSGMWYIMVNNKILATLKTTSSRCLPEIASLSNGWSENYGAYFHWMYSQPSLKCTKLNLDTRETRRPDIFQASSAGSINMDLFIKYSKEPERLGLTVPLFVKYSHIQVATLRWKFARLHGAGAVDLDGMGELSEKVHDVERTCNSLLKSLDISFDKFPNVEPAPPSICAAIILLQKELAVYFLELSDINNGNFEAARRCRDTQAELTEMVRSLTKKEKEEETDPAPVCPSPRVSIQEPAKTEDDQELSAEKAVVANALSSNLIAVESVPGNEAAQRIVHDPKSEWSCRIKSVGWVPVHARENRTTMDIEWKCTVTIGLSRDTSTKIGAALTAGFSTICAQLSLDMNWSSSASKQTEHEHTFKILPNTKLVVEQEVIEGVIILKGKKSVWGSVKEDKEGAFKVAKDSLRIVSVTL